MYIESRSFASATVRLVRRFRAGLGLGAGVAACGLATCVVAAPYNPEHLAAGDHAQVAGVCRGVMGISPGIARFDACLEGLSASLRELGRERVLAASRVDCLHSGLPVGGAALAQCELDRSRNVRDAGATVLAAASPAQGSPAPARPYWAASNAEVHRREETACARLGLEPVGGAFARCVITLEASLFAADNPSQ